MSGFVLQGGEGTHRDEAAQGAEGARQNEAAQAAQVTEGARRGEAAQGAQAGEGARQPVVPARHRVISPLLCRPRATASLLAAEWRKLLGLPALWAYLALCLALNGLLMWENDDLRPLFNEVGAQAAALGPQAGDDFATSVATLPPSETRDALEGAIPLIEGGYEAYGPEGIMAEREERAASSPLAAAALAAKHDRLRERMAHLTETGAARDLYAAAITREVHGALFGALLPAVVGEAMLFGMLAALYLLGYEQRWRTADVALSSRTGRRLATVKVAAALAAALAGYLGLSALTLAAFFAWWDFGSVASASVATSLNFVTEGLIAVPFITWADFSVAGYLAACLALGAALVTACTLAGSACGLLLGGTLRAVLALGLVGLGTLAARSLCAGAGWWTASALWALSPSALWLMEPRWFTDAGIGALVPWQETVGAVANLVLLGALTAFALRRFRRKDVTPWNF